MQEVKEIVASTKAIAMPDKDSNDDVTPAHIGLINKSLERKLWPLPQEFAAEDIFSIFPFKGLLQ